MYGFFKPLRRKLGVVTLVMACVFAAAWVRSLTELDIVVRLNANNTHLMMSVGGTLNWERMWPIVIPRPSRWMYRHQSSSPKEDFDVSYGFLGLGFDIRNQSRIETKIGTVPYIAESETWQIPYWSIVIPLTLLSAWLLFSNRRQSKTPTKLPE
jgi:hypothetical protein